MNIKLRPEDKVRILNGHDLFKVMQRVLAREEKLDQDKEHFWIAGLDNINRLIFLELISLGNISSYPANPMDVFRVGVLKGAVRVAMVHNHPDGDIRMSAGDRDVTDRMIQVGLILNINVFDHVIISPDSYFSFNDIGLIDELAESTKWMPNAEQLNKIRKEYDELLEIGKQEAYVNGRTYGEERGLVIGYGDGKKEGIEIGFGDGFEKGKIEMAKQFLINGVDIELVVKSTGLSKTVVSKLLKEIKKR